MASAALQAIPGLGLQRGRPTACCPLPALPSPRPPSSTPSPLMSTQLPWLRVTPACPPLPGSPHLYIGTSNGTRGFSRSACGPVLHQVPEAEESHTPPGLSAAPHPIPAMVKSSQPRPWSSPVSPTPKQTPALPTSCQDQCPLRVTAWPLPGRQLHTCCHPFLHKGGKTESPSCPSISPPWSLVPGTSRACLPLWPSAPPAPGALGRATPAACFFSNTAP